MTRTSWLKPVCHDAPSFVRWQHTIWPPWPDAPRSRPPAVWCHAVVVASTDLGGSGRHRDPRPEVDAGRATPHADYLPTFLGGNGRQDGIKRPV